LYFCRISQASQRELKLLLDMYKSAPKEQRDKVFLNNILVISWSSVLLVEETGGPGENYRPAASHRQTSSHNVVHLIKT
jgi:hypothetical protein